MATTEKKQTRIVRNSAGLRDAIFDEIDGIRSGTSNPTRANAIAKLAAGIVETVRMEVEVQKYLRSISQSPTGTKQIAATLGAPVMLSGE